LLWLRFIHHVLRTYYKGSRHSEQLAIGDAAAHPAPHTSSQRHNPILDYTLLVSLSPPLPCFLTISSKGTAFISELSRTPHGCWSGAAVHAAVSAGPTDFTIKSGSSPRGRRSRSRKYTVTTMITVKLKLDLLGRIYVRHNYGHNTLVYLHLAGPALHWSLRTADQLLGSGSDNAR